MPCRVAIVWHTPPRSALTGIKTPLASPSEAVRQIFDTRSYPAEVESFAVCRSENGLFNSGNHLHCQSDVLNRGYQTAAIGIVLHINKYILL